MCHLSKPECKKYWENMNKSKKNILVAMPLKDAKIKKLICNIEDDAEINNI